MEQTPPDSLLGSKIGVAEECRILRTSFRCDFDPIDDRLLSRVVRDSRVCHWILIS